jgi:hypothetical protein
MGGREWRSGPLRHLLCRLSAVGVGVDEGSTNEARGSEGDNEEIEKPRAYVDKARLLQNITAFLFSLLCVCVCVKHMHDEM